MSRDAFPRLDREYNEREERLDEIREQLKEWRKAQQTCKRCGFQLDSAGHMNGCAE